MTFFKNKQKAKLPKAPEPRAMDELIKANAELKQKAADAQYLVYVYSKDLEQINQALVAVNQEAAARKKLDTEKETANVNT